MANRGKGFLISYTVIKDDKDRNNEDNRFRGIINDVLEDDGYEYISETTYFKLYDFSINTSLRECTAERKNLLDSIIREAKSNKIKYYETPDYFEVSAVLASCH